MYFLHVNLLSKPTHNVTKINLNTAACNSSFHWNLPSLSLPPPRLHLFYLLVQFQNICMFSCTFRRTSNFWTCNLDLFTEEIVKMDGNRFHPCLIQVLITYYAQRNHGCIQFDMQTVCHTKCHGMTKSVKVHRKDQSVNKNAYFYYFGQFCVFL